MILDNTTDNHITTRKITILPKVKAVVLNLYG